MTDHTIATDAGVVIAETRHVELDDEDTDEDLAAGTRDLLAVQLIRIASAGHRIALTAQSTADLEALARRIVASGQGTAVALLLTDVESTDDVDRGDTTYTDHYPNGHPYRACGAPHPSGDRSRRCSRVADHSIDVGPGHVNRLGNEWGRR